MWYNCLSYHKLVELNKGKAMFFNKNSVPLHFNHIVRCALNVRFLNLWIRRGASTLRPLCSEDLIEAFFYLRLFTKCLVYAAKIRELVLHKLRERLNTSVLAVTPGVLEKKT